MPKSKTIKKKSKSTTKRAKTGKKSRNWPLW